MLYSLQKKLLTPEKSPVLILFIIFIAIIGIFATEMYIPSLPAIAQYFQSDHQYAQWSISIYLLAMGVSQFFYGPLSDRFGRRSILLIGLNINVMGNLVCVFSPSIHWLILGRLVQGMGVGAPLCLTRSICRDIFSGERFIAVGAYLSLATSIAPAVAPILGSYLQHWFGWRSNFIFLTAFGIIMLLLTGLFLPETNQTFNPKATQLKTVYRNYCILLTSRNFMSNLIYSSVAISGILVYYTISPFLFQVNLGLSTIEYGWLAIFSTGAMLLGRMINTGLLRYFSYDKLIFTGNIIMLLASLTLLMTGLSKKLDFLIIFIPIIIFILATGLVFSNAAAGALLPFPQMAGQAGAVFSGLQILGAFLSTTAAALLPHNNQIMLALVLTLLSLISLITSIVTL